MPARSKKQYGFMQKAAHDPEFAAEHGIKPSAAEEYVAGQSPKGLPERVKSAARKIARRKGK